MYDLRRPIIAYHTAEIGFTDFVYSYGEIQTVSALVVYICVALIAGILLTILFYYLNFICLVWCT
jgi:hypothetical protein